MTESELLKIATKCPPLTNEEMSDDLTEADIENMCDEAWSLLSQLSEKSLNQKDLNYEKSDSRQSDI